ncbi:MAG: SAF domain-containing protein [Actinomycetaceae bacterium]
MSRAASPPSRSTGTRLRRAAWRWRHAIAAVCLAVAASLAVDSLSPAPPATAAALVVGADLPAGHVVEPGDLALVDLPAGAVPSAALTDEGEVVGHPLAVGLPEGTVLSGGMVATPTVSAADGEVVVPVRISDDGSAALAGPGLRVSLLAPPADGGAAETVAEGVLVLGAVPEQDGGLLGAEESDVTRLYVSASPETATLLVGSSAWTPLSVALGPT